MYLSVCEGRSLILETTFIQQTTQLFTSNDGILCMCCDSAIYTSDVTIDIIDYVHVVYNIYDVTHLRLI